MGAGISAGLINGFFGGGGGMIVVPVFSMLFNSAKKSHATAVLTILPVSIVGAACYLLFNPFDLATFLPVVAGEISGGIIGALMLKKLPEKFIKITFIGVMLLAGVKMLFL